MRSLAALVLIALTACAPRQERPRTQAEAAAIPSRETTLMRPSVRGGDSQPATGTSEPDR